MRYTRTTLLMFIITNLLLIVHVLSAFRYQQAIALDNLPSQIQFMNDQIVLRDGQTVQIRSGENYTEISNTFTLPNQSSIAVLPGTQEILFISEKGISKSVKTRPDINFTISNTNILRLSSLRLSSNNDLFIVPPMNSTRQVTIINATDYSISYLTLSGTVSTAIELRSEVIVRGGRYYFSNGLAYSNSTPQQQYLYFYQGFQGAYSNVFNFSVTRNSQSTLLYPRQFLQSIEQNGTTSFLIAKEMSFSNFAMQIATLNASSYSSSAATNPMNARTFRLVNSNKFIYFQDSYCGLFQTLASYTIPTYDAIDRRYLLVPSSDSNLIVGFDTSFIFNKMFVSAVLYEVSTNSTFALKASIPQSTGGIGFINCGFFNLDQYIGVYQGTNQTGYYRLSFYSIQNMAYISSFLYEVDDYCLSPNSNLVFIRTNLTLMAYRFQNELLNLQATSTLATRITLNFTCSWDESVFVFSSVAPYPFQKWQLRNGTLAKAAQITRDSGGAYYFQAIFQDSVMFAGVSTGLYFFDYNLKNFTVAFNEDQYIQFKLVKNHFLVFTDNFASSATYSVLYEYVNKTLVYKGHYPVSLNSQTVLRRIIFPMKRQIYLDYINSSSLTGSSSAVYQIDNPQQIRLGYIYDDDNSTSCDFQTAPAITSALQMIAITKTFSLNKYLLLNSYSANQSTFLSSFSSINNLKVSNSQTHICIWGLSLNSVKYLQVRLKDNLQKVVYLKEVSLDLYENILDCQVNTNQTVALLTYKSATVVNLYLFQNNFKEVNVDPFIASVTVMAVSQETGTYAYTGIDSVTKLPVSYIIVDSLVLPSNSSKIQCQCQVKLIVFGHGQSNSSIGYVCINNTVEIRNLNSQTVYQQNFTQTVLKLQILGQNKLLVTTSLQIIIVDIPISLEETTNTVKLSAVGNSSIAVDYNNSLIAYSSDLKTIIISDFTGNTVDSIINKDGLDAVAITFKQTGELYVTFNGTASNAVSSLVIWTNQSCPQNETLSNNYCVCINTYYPINGSCLCINNQVVIGGLCGCANNLTLLNDSCGCLNNLINLNDYCVCPNNLILLSDSCGCWSNLVLKDGVCKCDSNLILINDTCGCSADSQLINNICQCKGDLSLIADSCSCSSGFTQIDNYLCQKCSFTCKQCQNGGAFSCKEYSAWFYVIVIVGPLLIIGVGVVIVFVVKRRRPKTSQLQTNSQNTTEGAFLSRQGS